MARKTKTPKNPNKRAERGTGSIRMKDNGKYEYRVTYKDPYGNSRRKTFTSYYKDECYEMCEAFLQDLDKINYGVRMNATIPDLVEAHYKRKLDYSNQNHHHRSGCRRAR